MIQMLTLFRYNPALYKYLYKTYNLLMNLIDRMPKAVKQLRKIEKTASKKIRQTVNEELKNLGTARSVKKLTNHQYDYRLRVGNYRVFFDFDGEIRIVSIEEVRKRDERTY